MIVPLKINVDLGNRLRKCLKKFPHEKKLADTIAISSNIVMLHAHDFLDQRLIEKGVFVPHYSEGSYSEAIKEIVNILQTTIMSR